MPANRFAPDRLVVGHEQDARIIDRILQAILARWPIGKCDIASVYSQSIDWSDGGLVPTENINVEELFNNATGIAAALGCMQFRYGMIVQYDSATTIRVTAGGIIHRGDFKIVECTDATTLGSIATTGLVDPDCAPCAPTEGNPSGLDSDRWYYVYANMGAAGTTPNLTELIRISETPPVHCAGKGWEHPDNTDWAFLNSIRTMASGEIRPFDRTGGGWTFWRFADAASDYQSVGAAANGTNFTATSGSWVRYETGTTGTNYHDGDKHIPLTADFVRVCVESSAVSGDFAIRSVMDSSLSLGFGVQQSGDFEVTGMLPVNPFGGDTVDMQTFMWNGSNDVHLDVVAYHEPLQ